MRNDGGTCLSLVRAVTIVNCPAAFVRWRLQLCSVRQCVKEEYAARNAAAGALEALGSGNALSPDPLARSLTGGTWSEALLMNVRRCPEAPRFRGSLYL